MAAFAFLPRCVAIGSTGQPRKQEDALAEPPDLSGLHERARDYIDAGGRSNAPLPEEFPARAIEQVAAQLLALDGVSTEAEKQALVYARQKLREARKVLRMHARDPEAPGYFELERAHNALFVEIDDLVEALPPAELIELQPSTGRGPLVVRRLEIAKEIEEMEVSLTEIRARGGVIIGKIDNRQYSLVRIDLRDLRVKIGSLINNSMTLSAELATALVSVPWVAKLVKRLGQLADGLSDAIQELRRVVAGVGELVEDAGRMKDLAKRVVEGGKALFRAIRRRLGGRPLGGSFRDIDAAWCPEMVEVPAGRFLMGSAPDEAGGNTYERPQHEVRIARPFALGRYPVTFEQYDHFCLETGRGQLLDRGWGRGRRPVIRVSWHDAAAYCAWLSERAEASYRLPSEAEWEYACRAGTTSAYSWGDAFDARRANGGRELGRTTEVDAYRPNGWGLHDMHGNVWEWCEDAGHPDYAGAPEDGTAWVGGGSPDRVLRGGSWANIPRDLRSATRTGYAPESRDDGAGFRVARMLAS